MKKILAFKNGVGKLNNVFKFAKVLIRTFEYFKTEFEIEFPESNIEIQKDGE